MQTKSFQGMSLILPTVFVLFTGFVLAACTSPNNEMMNQETQMEESEQMMGEDEMMEEEGVMVGGAMMVASKTIVENAVNAPNLTTLVSAVEAADLVDTLNGPGPFTVFAPTNDAFAKLPAADVENLLKPENKAMLTSVLTYHVVAGSYRSSDLRDGMKLETVNGAEITITEQNGMWMVNGATITTADVIDSNGVSHIIDTVLIPPTN